MVAQQGMIVSPHTLASQAGEFVMRRGGNAVDGAIATNAALCVLYPHMTGLGGDANWLIYDSSSQQLHGLNGCGRAAQAATLERYQAAGYTSIPERGVLAAITVPGALDSWWQAHQRFGHLPWAELIKPAVQLALKGYPVAPSLWRWTKRDFALLQADPGSRATFLQAGQLPERGQSMANPDLARVLAAIATQGIHPFYQGSLAQRMVEALQAQGGLLNLEDFAQYQSQWVTPIETTYRGHRICQLPPNTQGLTVLQILNLLEAFDLKQLGQDSADYLHLIVEATKLAFCDRTRWISDPKFIDIPVERLISKAYAYQRQSRISFSYTQPYQPGPVGGDTIYCAVVDAQGNAVSMLQSLFFDYGSGFTPPGLGFSLTNRGAAFSLDPAHANCLAPGKRPFHTLIPAMALQSDGRPELVFGTMGGEGQPQTQIALLTRVLDFGIDVQTALDLPRWRWGRAWGDSSTRLALEGRIPSDVQRALAKRGHHLQILPDWSEEMGHAHMIRITTANDGLKLEGGCDRRSDGHVVSCDTG
jgi:gamma-glutamyltranspeptidase